MELTFFNKPTPTSQPIDAAIARTPAARTWTRLRQVRQAYLERASLAPDVRQDLDALLPLLPQPWRTALTADDTPAPPFVAISAPGTLPVIFRGPTTDNGLQTTDNAQPATRLYLLSPHSGLLLPLDDDDDDAPDPSIAPRPALVIWRPKPNTAWTRSDYDYEEIQRYLPPEERHPINEPWLVGLWEDLDLDPRVWGLTHPSTGLRTTLLDLDVKTARQHFLRAEARTWQIPGYAQHGVVWPALWPHNPLPLTPMSDTPDRHLHRWGLPGLEEGWRRTAASPLAPPEDDTFADYVTADYVDRPPPWLSLAPGPSSAAQTSARAARARTRSETRLAAATTPTPPTTLPASPPPPTPPTLTPPPFPWPRLLDPTLPRPFTITAWRALHGQLGCNAILHHVQRHIRTITSPCQPFCPAPCCRPALALVHPPDPPLETLTHLFFTCPDFAPVLPWLCSVWAALTGRAAPPLTATLLLGDDLREWTTDSPAGDLRLLALWTRLRVCIVGAIWRVRCLRQQGTALSASPARLAVSMAVNIVREAIERDWLRTTTDIRQLDNGYFSVEWWRGQDPSLTFAQFEELWASPPVLCSATEGDPEADPPVPHSLVIRIDTDTPIPFPP